MNNQGQTHTFKRAQFEGVIHLINSNDDLNNIISLLRDAKILGFDTETKPSFSKGEYYKVSLLQLSTSTDAFLFRLHFIDQFSSLKEIFENEDVIKVGLAIRDDIKALQKMFSFGPKSFIELQEIAKTEGLKNFGLKGMSEEVLNLTLSKRAKLTNWEAKSLSQEQQNYAATDAWIGLKLYEKLKSF
jgi:ribonuclease D